jgi:hypothetical protein
MHQRLLQGHSLHGTSIACPWMRVEGHDSRYKPLRLPHLLAQATRADASEFFIQLCMPLSHFSRQMKYVLTGWATLTVAHVRSVNNLLFLPITLASNDQYPDKLLTLQLEAEFKDDPTLVSRIRVPSKTTHTSAVESLQGCQSR